MPSGSTGIPPSGPGRGEPRLLTGWGRTAPTAAHVLDPSTRAELALALASAGPRGVIARGLGRGYGDAAQCAGGLVLDTSRLDRILAVDLAAGTVTCEAGVSLHRLMTALLPLGLFVPVTPGTRYVTVGGAIAADIHGKNHHVAGSFATHVSSFDLLLADGAVRTVHPDDDPDLFWATAGGMGLTGVILAATIRMVAVETAQMVVDTERVDDLEALLDRLARTDAAYRYSVAWVDLLARGRRLGRAVLTRGDHARRDELSGRAARDPLGFRPRGVGTVPRGVPGGLLRRATIAAFNEAWYRRAPRERRGELQSLGAFFHPLDGLRDWNRLYGPAGFVQYQFVVPLGAEDALTAAVHRLSAARTPSFLTVLKRFGPGDAGPLSFPTRGWTLALDIPASVAGLPRLLDELDELVATAEGRVYLAKDSRVRPELLPVMYPRLSEFRAVRRRVDPSGRFCSDLARRLSL